MGVNSAFFLTLFKYLPLLLGAQINQLILFFSIGKELFFNGKEGAMGHAVWHTSTTVRILVTDVMEVACDATLCLAALCLWVQVGHITERVLGVIG